MPVKIQPIILLTSTKRYRCRKVQQKMLMITCSPVGMYGDLQGIAGKSLQEIEGLELHALEAPIKLDE